jgi:transcription factor SPN1
MLQKMKQAAETDHELNKMKQPAIAKLKMLSAVQEQLNKANIYELFLDNNILEGIKVWLEPMLGDGSLPSLDIQRVMMRALMNMPIRTVHLRESGTTFQLT